VRRLTTPQRLTLLTFLIIAAVGIAKGQKVEDPEQGRREEKMTDTDMDKSQGRPAGYGDVEDPEQGRRVVCDRPYLELQRDAALWREQGWRAEAHLVRLYIESKTSRCNGFNFTDGKSPELPYTEYLARAFVRAAREFKLRLWIAVAIAQKESNFDNSAVGKQGERTLMQIFPLPGQEQVIKDGLADPAKAIKWAGQYLADGLRLHGNLEEALGRYNGGPGARNTKPAKRYAADVMALGAAMVEANALWGLVPE